MVRRSLEKTFSSNRWDASKASELSADLLHERMRTLMGHSVYQNHRILPIWGLNKSGMSVLSNCGAAKFVRPTLGDESSVSSDLAQYCQRTDQWWSCWGWMRLFWCFSHSWLAWRRAKGLVRPVAWRQWWALPARFWSCARAFPSGEDGLRAWKSLERLRAI